jgi:hypothetical protein
MSELSTPCIEWERYRTRAGYGQQGIGGKVVYAHRVAYCNAQGISLDAIAGLEVRHICDNPPCINPEHLVLGTHADNMRDMVERNRQPRATDRPNGVLSAADVQYIRSVYRPRHREFGGSALARRYNVCQQLISMVTRGIRHGSNTA